MLDGFGHVSVRSDRDPNHYFMSLSLAPATVHEADILEYDLDSNPIRATESRCTSSASFTAKSTRRGQT